MGAPTPTARTRVTSMPWAAALSASVSQVCSSERDIDGDDGETMWTAARTDPDRLSMTPAQEVRVMSRPTACAAVALRARS